MTSLAMAAGRPAATQDFWQPRRAAFWALAALLIYGGITIGNLTLEAFREYPVATGIGIPLWVAYAIPLFLLIRWLDLYAQNSGLGMTLAIAYGAFGATALALRANEGLDGIVEKVGGSNLASDWGPALEGPTTEEPLKLLGVILLVMIARTRFRTILPAVFFGALVGLGFQVSEDLIYTANAAHSWTGDSEIAPVTSTFFARGLVSGLFSHAAFTAIAAFGVGYFYTREREPLSNRVFIASAAFAVAVGLHFFWNSPILTDWLDGVAVLLAIAVKAAPIALAVALVWRTSVAEQARLLRSLASLHVSPNLITASERETLGALRARRRARKQAKRAGGKKLERAVTRLQREQMRLLVAIHQDGPDSPRACKHEEAIRRLRAETRSLLP